VPGRADAREFVPPPEIGEAVDVGVEVPCTGFPMLTRFYQDYAGVTRSAPTETMMDPPGGRFPIHENVTLTMKAITVMPGPSTDAAIAVSGEMLVRMNGVTETLPSPTPGGRTIVGARGMKLRTEEGEYGTGIPERLTVTVVEETWKRFVVESLTLPLPEPRCVIAPTALPGVP
jgi:hypothetical protein